MKIKLILVVIGCVSISSLGLYQIITSMSFIDGNQQTAAVWFANNPQSIDRFYFGPSPRSEDSSTIFTNRVAFWNKMTERNQSTKSYNAIELHMSLIDNKGVFNPKDQLIIDSVTLSDEGIKTIKKMQVEKNLHVSVAIGNSLRMFCRESNLIRMAEQAADLELSVVKRLFDAGILVNEYLVDGPFLSLIGGSSKELHSSTPACYRQGRTMSTDEVTSVVAHYLSKISEGSKTFAGKASYQPEITLIVNLPNWQVGQFNEMHWGMEAKDVTPTYDEIIASFSKKSYPPIQTILVDYPYSLIDQSKAIFTREDARGVFSNCKQNAKCTRITSSESFRGKITAIPGLARQIKGEPKMSFYINTEDSYGQGKGNPLCATATSTSWVSNTRVPYIVYKYNRCFNGEWPFALSEDVGSSKWNEHSVNTKVEADADQQVRDDIYFQETRKYYNLVTFGLPKGIDIDRVYITSWHTNPRYSVIHGLRMLNVLNE